MITLILGIFLGVSGVFVFGNRRALKCAFQQTLNLNVSTSTKSLLCAYMIYQIFLDSLSDESTIPINTSSGKFEYIEFFDNKRNKYSTIIPIDSDSKTYIEINEKSNLYNIKGNGRLLKITPSVDLNKFSELMDGFENFVVVYGSSENTSNTFSDKLYQFDDVECPIE